MSSENSSNGNSSATPRPTAHSNYERLTEAEFLAHQADLAKTALANTLAEFKASLSHAADPKLWAHHHPWVSVGVAAATGFTLAAVVRGGDTTAPDRDETARHHMVNEAAKAMPGGRESKHRYGESLLGSLFSIARTALEASLVSAIHAQGNEQSQPGGPANTAPAPRTESQAVPTASHATHSSL